MQTSTPLLCTLNIFWEEVGCVGSRGDGGKAGRKVCWVLLGREITSDSGIPQRGNQVEVRTALVVSTDALFS